MAEFEKVRALLRHGVECIDSERCASAAERASLEVEEAEALLELAEAEREISGLRVELERQQEMWSMQSRLISALSEHVPDEVRAAIAAKVRET